MSRGEPADRLLAGCEALGTFHKAVKSGYVPPGTPVGAKMVGIDGRQSVAGEGAKVLPWGDDPGGAPERLGWQMEDAASGEAFRFVTLEEALCGVGTPTTMYAIFEQAIRAQRGASVNRRGRCR